jgi:hypothetical protein
MAIDARQSCEIHVLVNGLALRLQFYGITAADLLAPGGEAILAQALRRRGIALSAVLLTTLTNVPIYRGKAIPREYRPYVEEYA